MASLNSRPLPAGLAAQQQGAATAPQSPRGAPGFAVAAAEKQGAAMVAAPPYPRGGAPGFAVVPQGAAPASPQGPPGFWVAPQQSAPAPSQVAPVVAPLQGAIGMAPQQQQQHFAPVMVPGSQQGMQMAVQPASMAMMMASMSQQAQAQAMAAHQPAQGMAPSQSLPTYLLSMMQMQQAQAGHMMETPPLPLGPPPLVQQQQQQQPSQADPAMTAQPPLPLRPPPVMLQQQTAQGGPVMMTQSPLPFSSPSVMLPQNPQINQMMMGQPQLSALPCKRQRVDQYDNPYGQHMTGHQQETTIFNTAMGQSFGPNLHNEFSSFGASMPSSLPKDATSTVYVDGLPNNCTRREVAHIFRQYMGFREVRLVNKGSSRHAICFVDFATPTHAFLAMRTLQVGDSVEVISSTNRILIHAF
ncbi:mediator of RNA polymerase II transcription subunit 15-like isoform X2 [Panicum virgatum]|uniref:mediator of RNA polymerase II transcription subunit 15-like isoform X2 n=1 Tax=Panicum virgatum TaxID=38727 RepID=UPI0019D51811|nr:mediator of RNA polymerase II transcription subunit 15-like isoform X2 [Panicum virgatum]